MAFALDIFPAEIWLEISGKVENPQDWLNLYHSSVAIQGVLECQKVDKLFPEILSYNAHEYEDKKDLLKLRLISKTWKSIVDKIAEQLYLTSWSNASWKHLGLGSVTLRDSEHIRNFLQDMETHVGNPFIGKNLNLYSNPTNQEFWTSAEQLMGRFGKYVRRLTLIPSGAATLQFDQQLYGILKYVPYLQQLFVRCDNMLLRHTNPPDIGLPPLDFVNNDVHPVLQQLECFTVFESEKYVAHRIFHLIHKMCKYPEKVTHLWVTHIPEYLAGFFPNVVWIQGSFTSEDWENLGNSEWPLKTIYGESEDNLEELNLEIIHKFQETLTNLRLDSVYVVLYPSDKFCRF